MGEEVFSYTPSFGKPIVGKAAFSDAARSKLAGQTNIEHSWESDRRIVASASGDMAYEHGTMDVSYNEDGKPRSTKLVILDVYKAKGDVCERVAQTIQRLEEDVIPTLHDISNY
jgi:hypothetical protein